MPKSRPLLTPEQRGLFMCIPENLSDRDIVRYYTFTPHDLVMINQQHNLRNRLGFAVQVAVLRFPGRTLTEIPSIPDRILNYIAEQLGVPADKFADYGQRVMTVSEHLTKLRRVFGYRDYGWSAMLEVSRQLLPIAMESEQRLPLIETALTILREQRIIAPTVSTVERLVWGVHRMARRRVYRHLTRQLTSEQQTQLDSIIIKKGKGKAKTQLSWLRAAPGLSSSPESLTGVLNRLAFIRSLQLPATTAQVPPNRIRQLANRGRQYTPQALAKLKKSPIRRHALLVAHLSELSRDLTDQAVDMFDRMMGDLLRKGERKQDQHLHDNAKTLNENVQILAAAVEAFLKAYVDHLDPFSTVFAKVSQDQLIAALLSTQAVARPVDLGFLDLIEDRYGRRRKTLLYLYRLLNFSAVQQAEPVLQALDHVIKLADHHKRVEAVKQKIKKIQVQAPVAHLLRTRWEKHALKGAEINPNYYEIAAFDLLKARLRSGDIAVAESRRYQDFNSGLLEAATWQHMRDHKQTRLAITGTAQQYFDEVERHLKTRMTELTETFTTNPALKLDEQGSLMFVPYETEVPEPVKKFRRKLYQRVPMMQIPEVGLDVHGLTKCLDRFVDPLTGKPPQGRDQKVLLAAILALGMNIGLKKMAQATPFSYAELSRIAETYIREETLTRTLHDLDNFALQLPMSRYWGDGSASSSDGMRMIVPVKAANTDYNARYFGHQRGLTFLTHTADIQMPLSPRVISTNEKEALYTIDLLCNHETDLHITEHYTDTAGYTFHVFALCVLLGFRFAPSIRSMLDQYLYSVTPITIEGPLAALYHGAVDTALIAECWDDLLRLAASIRHGKISAALMMRKLAAHPRQNRLAKALNELGKLERTLFILDYLADESLRKRVRAGLNKGESLHALARALFFGQRGELRERNFEDQLHRASCLMLLIGMISTWNTVYLQKSWETLQAEDPAISDELLPFVSPLSWNHINFLGQYHIDAVTAWSLEYLRPLRSSRKYQTVEDSEQL